MQLGLHEHNTACLADSCPHKALQDGHNDGSGAELEGGLGGAQLGGDGGQAGGKPPHQGLQIYHP